MGKYIGMIDSEDGRNVQKIRKFTTYLLTEYEPQITRVSGFKTIENFYITAVTAIKEERHTGYK